MSKKSKNQNKLEMASRKSRNLLYLIPLFAFIIKSFMIARIQGFDWYSASGKDLAGGLKLLLDKNYLPSHIWYGADGENYLRALTGLVRDGIYSTETNLHYWPAGYPLFLWIIALVFKGNFLTAVAVIQSALYAVACAYFSEEVRHTRLKKFAIPLALALTLNPTLALNSMSVGYEIPAVALTLISTAAMLRHLRRIGRKVISWDVFIASTSYFAASLMQPRLLAFALVFFVIWSLAAFEKKSALAFLSITLAIVAIAPSLLIMRNEKANGFASISTNLGTTMNIGAGPESSGGYTNKATGVNCPPSHGDAASQDRARVNCVLKWYVENPVKTLELAWNKSLYFWSPWFGPIANGTMARNPWSINHPFAETIKTESGFSMVYGTGGKLLSWAWMLFTLTVMFYGFALLWQAGNLERVFSLVALSTIIINWLSSIATIGDHRFRIPSMGMSLFLQTVGFTALFLKKKRRLSGTSIPVEWPGLHWKARSRPDNLPS
jgi:hypothetical protein